jgi:hypothetical protein
VWAQIAIIPSSPLNQFSIDDLWNLSISLPASSSFISYRISMDLYEKSKGLVLNSKTAVFDYTGSLIILNKASRQFAEPFQSHFVNTELYGKVLESGGLFPAGDYTVVFHFLGLSDHPGQGLVWEELQSTSYNHSLGVYFPPMPVYPYHNDAITEAQPVFLWTSPYPLLAGQTVSYEFRMVELLEGQAALTAITSNPFVFSQKDINETFLPYPLTAQSLEENKLYAWQILAYDGEMDLGSSEVWVFSFSSFRTEPDPEVSKDIPTSSPSNCKALLKAKAEQAFYEVREKKIEVFFPDEATEGELIFRLYNTDKSLIILKAEQIEKRDSNKYLLKLEDIQPGFYLLIVQTKERSLFLRFKIN